MVKAKSRVQKRFSFYYTHILGKVAMKIVVTKKIHQVRVRVPSSPYFNTTKDRKMSTIKALLLIVCLSSLQTVDAQWLRRGNAYSQTENGYRYKGKEYVRGRDLPDNMNCPCPMCRDLVNAYRVAHTTGVVSAKPSVLTAESASIKLIGTPHEHIAKLVEVFQINPDKDFTLLDPGCGDARILIYAAKKFNANGIGIEINPETYRLAVKNVKLAGLENKITIYFGDSRDFSFKLADGVVMFLFPDLISDLTKNFSELKSGTRVVSFSHEIPMNGCVQCEDIFVWEKE